MTDTQRAEALAALADRLAELTTPAERKTHDISLERLADLIDEVES